MIPSNTEAMALWNTYKLPPQKQLHCRLVAQVALYFASHISSNDIHVNTSLLQAGALLHDIDKNIPATDGERHPDTAVRLLNELGMNEVAHLVNTHPLHAILDSNICPTTWEEKLLFLADKMVKYAVISVDERFALWRAEDLLKEDREILEKAYPKVKDLEKEILTRIHKTTIEVINANKTGILTWKE